MVRNPYVFGASSRIDRLWSYRTHQMLSKLGDGKLNLDKSDVVIYPSVVVLTSATHLESARNVYVALRSRSTSSISVLSASIRKSNRTRWQCFSHAFTNHWG